jgi:hypothetical protein
MELQGTSHHYEATVPGGKPAGGNAPLDPPYDLDWDVGGTC